MRISVVVPTFCEAATVARAVGSAQATLGDCEVIVVDADSPDGTPEAARAAGARVVVAPGSRADAMNVGARAARGEVLLFLHADTTLPEGAGDAIRAALGDADGGAFRLRFDDRRPFIEALTDLRARFLRAVYGDQAIFLTRPAFDRLGGYRPLPIMEDYDLVRRLRRTGRFTLLPLSVRTAARRHRNGGALRTVVRIWAIQCLYHVGVSPTRLVRRYPPATTGRDPGSQPRDCMHVLIATKAPRADRSKTRLSPRLTPVAAARLHEALLLDTADCARRQATSIGLLVADPCDVAPLRALIPDAGIVHQQGTGLADALRHTFAAATPAAPIAVISSDTPGIPDGEIAAAEAALSAGADVSLSPAADGGYWMIAMSRPATAPFTDIPWSTPDCLAVTLARCHEASLIVRVGAAWRDIDVPEDLDWLAGAVDARLAPRTAALLPALLG